MRPQVWSQQHFVRYPVLLTDTLESRFSYPIFEVANLVLCMLGQLAGRQDMAKRDASAFKFDLAGQEPVLAVVS